MNVLLTGSSGQLCGALMHQLRTHGIAFHAPPEAELDITNPASIDTVMQTRKPDVIINTAAYNQVDAAEQDPRPAFAVNRDGPRLLAQAAHDHHARLVHFGTDYVFDGKARHLYTESDVPSPLNQYGCSKWAGEEAVRAILPQALILRLSWVFGAGQQNFFAKLAQWSRGKQVLEVVWDQISVPSYTEDVAMLTLAALAQGLEGCWHATNQGYATRYETARHFLACRGQGPVVIPVPSSHFPSPAVRPFFSAMSSQALYRALGQQAPTWEDAVARYAHTLLPPQKEST